MTMRQGFRFSTKQMNAEHAADALERLAGRLEQAGQRSCISHTTLSGIAESLRDSLPKLNAQELFMLVELLNAANRNLISPNKDQNNETLDETA